VEGLGCGPHGVREIRTPNSEIRMEDCFVTANGKKVDAALPCILELFLVSHGLHPRSVGGEDNPEAVILGPPRPALAAAGLAV